MTEETIANQGATPVVSEAPSVKAILAKKLGMTRIVKEGGEFIPVTVLEAGPCPVLQVKTKNNDGYDALQLGFGSAREKNISKAVLGHLKTSSSSPVRWIREFRLLSVDGFQAGQKILVSNFVAGDIVDVSGTNKGKGFAGVVKRHRFKGGPKTHGQSDRWRAPGSLGGQQPQRVFRGLRGPGHLGAVWTTVQRLEVVDVKPDQNILLIRGAVPGPNGACVSVHLTTRPRALKKNASAQAAPKKAAKPEAKKK
jgi:large subunit ribosomal protein L3